MGLHLLGISRERDHNVLARDEHAAMNNAVATTLAKKSGCMACHAVDKKRVGPSYKEIATKYKADKAAEAKLIEKVKKGGGGVWGPIPMPPNSPRVRDEDIKTLVRWILSK